MRAEAHELQYLVIRLAVDQQQVGLDVTVSVVLPVAGQGVADGLWWCRRTLERDVLPSAFLSRVGGE